MKICQRCKTSKELEEFSKDSKLKDGLRAWCRACCKQTRPTSGPKSKKRDWKRLGLDFTFEEYEELFNIQGGSCAICKQPRSSFNKDLSVDHDHSTGRVRGLLCGPCNAGIGMLKDSPEILESAILYLRRK